MQLLSCTTCQCWKILLCSQSCCVVTWTIWHKGNCNSSLWEKDQHKPCEWFTELFMCLLGFWTWKRTEVYWRMKKESLKKSSACLILHLCTPGCSVWLVYCYNYTTKKGCLDAAGWSNRLLVWSIARPCVYWCAPVNAAGWLALVAAQSETCCNARIFLQYVLRWGSNVLRLVELFADKDLIL